MSKGYTLTPSGPMPVKQLYTLTGGKVLPVDKAYTLTGGTARLWYQRGTPLGNLAVGSTVKIAVNGTDYDWLVVHQGIPDASIYDASCNGTWLLMLDIYEMRKWHTTNINDYASSTIHSYLNGTFLNLFEPNIKNAIKQAKIPYRKGSGSSTTVTSGSNGLSAKIFLLSATETSFDFQWIYMPNGEGTELSYFEGCANYNSDPKRVALFNGSADYWWLRSPQCYGGDSALCVSDSGNWAKGSCSYTRGVRPCMILPQDALVDDTGHIIAA